MHLRAKLTRQPKGGPFDRPEPDCDDAGRLDTSAAGAVGLGQPMPKHPGPRTYGIKKGGGAGTGMENRLDTSAAGADGVCKGTFSGADHNAPKAPVPTASGGGGSTSVSQPTSPSYPGPMKTMGGSGSYGVQPKAMREHVSRPMGVFDFPQEGGRKQLPQGINQLNRALNQVAPGSQTRNQ